LKAIDFCDRTNLTIWNALSHWFLGDTYFDIAEYKKSQKHHEKAISLLESSRLLSFAVALNELAIIRSKLRNQEEYNDLSSLDSYKNKIAKKNWTSWMYRYMTDIFLEINGQFYSEAKDFIKKAIEEDEKYGMMWFLAKDYALYAELFKRKGEKLKVKENLAKAIEIFKKCGADGWVKKYEKELASL
jgi:tetratricopeptide (TPR) repeat protein